MVFELAQFKTKAGISDADILTASQEAQDGFLAKQKGYISREFSKSTEGGWVDIVHWETMEDAQVAMQKFMGHPSTEKFVSEKNIKHLKAMRSKR